MIRTGWIDLASKFLVFFGVFFSVYIIPYPIFWLGFFPKQIEKHYIDLSFWLKPKKGVSSKLDGQLMDGYTLENYIYIYT